MGWKRCGDCRIDEWMDVVEELDGKRNSTTRV